jgi:hypothetical protein
VHSVLLSKAKCRPGRGPRRGGIVDRAAGAIKIKSHHGHGLTGTGPPTSRPAETQPRNARQRKGCRRRPAIGMEWSRLARAPAGTFQRAASVPIAFKIPSTSPRLASSSASERGPVSHATARPVPPPTQAAPRPVGHPAMSHPRQASVHTQLGSLSLDS